ncbi:MAG: hypothetical protein E7110_00630 [Bacteroidales bacterium]|nr:hypothetical protein [Bacteroidales bacterium]
MKKLHLLLAVFAILISCSKSDPENPDPQPEQPKQETITIAGGSDTAPVLGTTGGTSTVTFTASAAWSASVINTRASDWCSVSPTNGQAGTATITITVKENTTPDNRAASITITAGNTTRTIKVEQKQKDALTVSQSSFEVPAEGKEIKVVAKSNVSFTHTISTEAQSWIKVVTTKALKDSTLTFEIAKNESIEKRSGEIYLTSGNLKDTVKVHQAGEAPSIVISKDEYVLKSEGESFEVEVASNVNATMNLAFPEGVEPWIAENTTRAMSTNKYIFVASANETYDSRSAMIIFANAESNVSDTVRVTQAQKDAIVLAKSDYEFGKEGGNLDFEILTNVDITVTIPDSCASWISQVETRALETKTLYFNIAACDTLKTDRVGYITISGGNAVQTIKVVQKGLGEILEAEKQALIEFYKATGGDNWVNNTNWCSDKPVGEWYGIRTDDLGFVIEISLMQNNLKGSMPKLIGELKNLKYLYIGDNYLEGVIPPEIGNLSELKEIFAHGNMFTGSIPEEFCKLTNLERVFIRSTMLSGPIPTNIGDLKKLTLLNLCQNHLSGKIPESIIKLESLEELYLVENKLEIDLPQSTFLDTHWGQMLPDNAYDLKKLHINFSPFDMLDIDGNRMESKSIFSSNKYTLMYHYSTSRMYEDADDINKLKQLYSDYSEKGLEIIGYVNGEYYGENVPQLKDVETFISKNGIPWSNIFMTQDNCMDVKYVFYPYIAPTFTIVDSTGRVVFFNYAKFDSDIKPVINSVVGFVKLQYNDIYQSSDYSQDGKVMTIQSATKGDGINIVLMGDAYSDRQIADGTYKADMETMYNNLFTEEPYKSFKDHFNVYYVNAVSATEEYGYGNTVFDGYFGNGTLVGGNDGNVFKYALKAISEEEMDEALLIVSMNSDNYAGTCYMYYPDNSAGYGNGVSVSYFPRGGNAETFVQLLHHEACGHGFAKLADEYAYENMGAIPEAVVASHKSQQTDWGWWKNVDFTSDPTATRWSHFVNDTRYADEGLGAYEGGLTYWTGVWRPTENSIMRYNTGGFNAPSREAIYYRIHKLAYGNSWEYDYEKFVEWDARNRATASTRAMVYKPTNYKPTHPPVIVNKSWKDAK